MKILAVSAVIIGLDQITKTLIKNSLTLFDSIPVIENFLIIMGLPSHSGNELCDNAIS